MVDTKKDERPRIPLDALTFHGICEDNGVKIRRNQITHLVEIEGGEQLVANVYMMTPTDVLQNTGYTHNSIRNNIVTLFHDIIRLNSMYAFQGATIDKICQLIDNEADSNAYNPFTELLDTVEYDGKNHFNSLSNALRLTEPLQIILLKKFINQAFFMMTKPDDLSAGAEAMLVLCGRQGVGKTSFVRGIALDKYNKGLYKEGIMLNPRDTDSRTTATTCGIAELGELETTTTSRQAGELKQFVTSTNDEYRPPYGRHNVNYPRRTTYVGTVNTVDYNGNKQNVDFLIDETGSRRYWCVDFAETVDRNYIHNCDYLQLYKQAEVEYYEKLKKHFNYDDSKPLKAQPFMEYPTEYMEGWTAFQQDYFRLTDEEQRMVNAQNEQYTRRVPGTDEIQALLLKVAEGDAKLVDGVSIPQFIESWDILTRYAGKSIMLGKALSKLGIVPKHTKYGNLYKLPMPKYYAATKTQTDFDVIAK